jgi:hypothetical protein
MKQLRQCEYFDVNEVSQRINIQRPYFAFERLWQDGNSLVGDFSAEQPRSYEAGPVASGELGRHLAILGSCTAVALHDGPEAYYLATKAQFTRKYVNPASNHEIYSASAQVMNIDKRTLNISAQAWGSEAIAELKCEYVILSPSLFKRSFKHYASEYCPSPIESPYQHAIALHGLDYHDCGLNAYAGPLSPDQCAGHFSFYPCWPVAIIAQTGSQVTGEFLRENFGKDVRFHVRSTKLSAEKLVGAGTILKFSIEITEDNFPVLGTVTRVYRDDEEVAQLVNVLEIVLPTSSHDS